MQSQSVGTFLQLPTRALRTGLIQDRHKRVIQVMGHKLAKVLLGILQFGNSLGTVTAVHILGDLRDGGIDLVPAIVGSLQIRLEKLTVPIVQRKGPAARARIALRLLRIFVLALLALATLRVELIGCRTAQGSHAARRGKVRELLYGTGKLNTKRKNR